MKEQDFSVQELVNDPTFVEWAIGESTGKHAQKWNQWVEQSEENRKIAIQAQKQITGLRFTSPEYPDTTSEWAKVRAAIEKKESTSDNKKRKRLPYVLRVAAVLLIGACIGAGILYVSNNSAPVVTDRIVWEQVQTGYSEKKTINLPNGSKIVLGANSKLRYKSNWFDQTVKRVRLSGEAYFNIVPQEVKRKPKFVVQTEDGLASVWGTRFTINTYREGTKVVLEEGEVQVQVENARGERVIMNPGQMATFSKAQPQVNIEQVNPAVYTSWTTNELYFDNTPFSVLVDRIERTFGVRVKVKSPQLLDVKLSGSVDYRSLTGVLEAVSKLMDIDIQKSGKNIMIQPNQK